MPKIEKQYQTPEYLHDIIPEDDRLEVLGLNNQLAKILIRKGNIRSIPALLEFLYDGRSLRELRGIREIYELNFLEVIRDNILDRFEDDKIIGIKQTYIEYFFREEQ